jgi:hypothetical protein
MAFVVEDHLSKLVSANCASDTNTINRRTVKRGQDVHIRRIRTVTDTLVNP